MNRHFIGQLLILSALAVSCYSAQINLTVAESANGTGGSKPINLAVKGTLDWGVFTDNTIGAISPSQRKFGGSGFSSLTYGTNEFATFPNSAYLYQWTDGTPTAANTSQTFSHDRIIPSGGSTLSIALSAAATYTLTFYTTTFDTALQGTASLTSSPELSSVAQATASGLANKAWQCVVTTNGPDTLNLALVKNGGTSDILALEAFALSNDSPPITPTTPATTAFGRILCIGDSITEASSTAPPATGGGNFSWRYVFWKQMVDHQDSYQYVGSRIANHGGASTYPLYKGQAFANRHEAIWGTTTTERLNTLNGGPYWSDLNRNGTNLAADTAFLLIGVNDLGNGASQASIDGVASRIGTMISRLQTANANVKIGVISILPRYVIADGDGIRNDLDPRVPSYQNLNSILDDFPANKSTATSKVFFINLHPLMNWNQFYDGTHPNAAGEQLIGETIYNHSVAVVNENSYQAWRTLEFGSLDAPSSTPADDPDGDLRNNLEEFAFGTDPNKYDSALSALGLAGGKLTTTRRIPRTASLEYILQQSENLGTWSNITAEPEASQQSGNFETLTIQPPPIVPQPAKLFYRLEVKERATTGGSP